MNAIKKKGLALVVISERCQKKYEVMGLEKRLGALLFCALCVFLWLAIKLRSGDVAEHFFGFSLEYFAGVSPIVEPQRVADGEPDRRQPDKAFMPL